MRNFNKTKNSHQQNLDVSRQNPPVIELARKFLLDDLTGASIPGSRIINILKQIEAGSSLSNFTFEYLLKNGFIALHKYAKHEISFFAFQALARPEQIKRRELHDARIAKKEAEEQQKREAFFAKVEQEQKRAAALKRAYENDPRTIAKRHQNALRAKYDLSFYIEKEHFPKLMGIIKRADQGLRLKEKDIIWLINKDYDYGYYTDELRKRYHEIEALYYADKFKQSKDPWFAVNASSHYRKCEQSRVADSMLRTINISKLQNKKLKSAIFTTHGGAKRDLETYEDALSFGKQAHELTPKDFRPCTLLGAVYMETGNHNLGDEWYQKAVERGASEKSVDDDLRSIFKRAEPARRDELRSYLLKKDPHRYSWARNS